VLTLTQSSTVRHGRASSVVVICRGRPSPIARRSTVVVRYPPWLMVVGHRSSPVHRPSLLVIHPSSIIVGHPSSVACHRSHVVRCTSSVTYRPSLVDRHHRASSAVIGRASSAVVGHASLVASLVVHRHRQSLVVVGAIPSARPPERKAVNSPFWMIGSLGMCEYTRINSRTVERRLSSIQVSAIDC